MTIRTCHCKTVITTKNALRVIKQVDDGQRQLWFNCPGCMTTRLLIGTRPGCPDCGKHGSCKCMVEAKTDGRCEACGVRGGACQCEPEYYEDHG